jgi:hypothetical protein
MPTRSTSKRAEDPRREAENALIDMWAFASCDWLVHSRFHVLGGRRADMGDPEIPAARHRPLEPARGPQALGPNQGVIRSLASGDHSPAPPLAEFPLLGRVGW